MPERAINRVLKKAHLVAILRKQEIKDSEDPQLQEVKTPEIKAKVLI